MRDDAEKHAQFIYKCADMAPNGTQKNERDKGKIKLHFMLKCSLPCNFIISFFWPHFPFPWTLILFPQKKKIENVHNNHFSFLTTVDNFQWKMGHTPYTVAALLL